jgi:DNA-binding GntR family transcriptional regulator
VRTQETLTSQVVTSIRAAIKDGTMPGGVLHSVGSIADQLGVSRTPVREAVLQLANLGLVEIQKNRGFIVIEHDPADLERIFQIRSWLEVPAAGLAAQADAKAKQRIQHAYDRMLEVAAAGRSADLERYDAQFHSAILSATGNARLASIVDDLRDLLINRRHTTTDRLHSPIDIAHDHDEILRGIMTGDSALAEAAMQEHLSRIRGDVLHILATS